MPRPLTDYYWIVDGHNLVLNVPELSRLHSHESKKSARDAAARRLAGLAAISAHPVQLVFDGDATPGSHPGARASSNFSVRFVDPPAEADDWIARLARQEADAGKPVAVATSDRGLLARLAGSPPVHRMAVDAFWRESGRAQRQADEAAVAGKLDPRASAPGELVALEAAMSRPLPKEPPRAAAPRAPERPVKPVAPATPREGAPRVAAPPAEQSEPVPRPAKESRREKAATPPRDWRADLVAKKEKGRQRQLKRAGRRKGS